MSSGLLRKWKLVSEAGPRRQTQLEGQRAILPHPVVGPRALRQLVQPLLVFVHLHRLHPQLDHPAQPAARPNTRFSRISSRVYSARGIGRELVQQQREVVRLLPKLMEIRVEERIQAFSVTQWAGPLSVKGNPSHICVDICCGYMFDLPLSFTTITNGQYPVPLITASSFP